MEIDNRVLEAHAALIRAGLDPDYAAVKIQQHADTLERHGAEATAKEIIGGAPEKFIDPDFGSGSSFLDKVLERVEAEKAARRGETPADGGGNETVYDRIRRQAQERRKASGESPSIEERLGS